MPVNSFIVYGSDGVVVVDSMLTVSDATSVRDAVRASGRTMAGVVVTHPHPDHHAGLGYVVRDDDVPIIATGAVDAIIRRDDDVNNAVVGPMMRAEWPTTRPFPGYPCRPPLQSSVSAASPWRTRPRVRSAEVVDEQ